MKKKILRSLSLIMMTGLLIVSSSACGKSKDSNGGTTNTAIPVSEAFSEEGIWFYSNDPVTKDAVIDAILVFDGNGNVTRYDTNCAWMENLKFGDLQDLSEDEILELAKEKDKESFEHEMQDIADDGDYVIEGLEQSLENSTGPIDPEKTAAFQESLNVNKLMRSKVDPSEYKEPQANPFKLKIETDGTGNRTANETIEYSYTEVYYSGEVDYTFNPELTMDDIKENGEWTPYRETKSTITLYPSAGAMTVYDMQFISSGYLSQKIEGEHPGFVLDTPNTEGIEVD